MVWWECFAKYLPYGSMKSIYTRQCRSKRRIYGVHRNYWLAKKFSLFRMNNQWVDIVVTYLRWARTLEDHSNCLPYHWVFPKDSFSLAKNKNAVDQFPLLCCRSFHLSCLPGLYSSRGPIWLHWDTTDSGKISNRARLAQLQQPNRGLHPQRDDQPQSSGRHSGRTRHLPDLCARRAEQHRQST